MEGSGAAVAAEAGHAAHDARIQIPPVGMPVESAKPQPDGDGVSGLDDLPETDAVGQPAASNIEGEDLGAALGERDCSDQQGSPTAFTTKLSPKSDTRVDDSPKSPLYDKPLPHHGDSGIYISARGNDDAEEEGRTVRKVGIVYPLGGEETDAVNYQAGASLLAKALGATVYPFTDKKSLFRAIETAAADQVHTLFLIGHGSENGSFGPSPNERLKANASEVVSKLLLAKITHVVLACCCAGTIAEKYLTQVCGRTHDIA